MAVRNSLIVPDKTINAVYFVESGWVSLVVTLEDGTQAEVGLVGREGMVGLPLIFGIETCLRDAEIVAAQQAGKKQAEIAKQTGLSQGAVSKIVSRSSGGYSSQHNAGRNNPPPEPAGHADHDPEPIQIPGLSEPAELPQPVRPAWQDKLAELEHPAVVRWHNALTALRAINE